MSEILQFEESCKPEIARTWFAIKSEHYVWMFEFTADSSFNVDELADFVRIPSTDLRGVGNCQI